MATDPTGRVSHLPEMHRGVSWKQPCRAATTANITISTALNNGDTIDGVTLATGDRVLVKDQTSGAENGIYVVAASPTRAYDMDQDASTSVPAEEVLGAHVYVIAGTVNAQTTWHTTNTTAPTIGTTAITWEPITSSVPVGTYVLATDGGEEVVQSHGTTGSTETIDLANGNSHAATLDANCTFTFTGATSGTECSFLLELTEDGTGGWTPTWPGSVAWPGGSTPAHVTTASSVTIYAFRTRDGGTTWYGFQAGSGTTGLSDPMTTRGDIITRGASATQRLALGTSGYVLTSDGTDAVWAAAAGGGSFVGASAYHSTTQSISGSTITQANLDSEDFDTSTFHDNSTNNTRMTVPSNGYYLVRAHANFAAGTATIVGLKKNGSMVRGSAVLGASGAALNTVKIVSLSTSDYIEMWVYATAGTTIGDATNIENQTSLDIQFLGA